MHHKPPTWRGARPWTAPGLTRPWLVITLSAAVVAALVVLLSWNPHRGRLAPGTEPLLVYCANGMIVPMQEIKAAYERDYGTPVTLLPDGSGKLLGTIRARKGQGDLFLAAEPWYIDQARQMDGGLVAESLPVAVMRPVLAVAADNPKGIKGLDDLLRPEVRVALANPSLASIGRLGREALLQSGHWPRLEQRLKDDAGVSFVGTVNEVVQAVKIGGADVGLAWDALALGQKLGIVRPPELAPLSAQVTLGVLSQSRQPTRALHFARYVSARDRGQRNFLAHDFAAIADADAWSDRPRLVVFAGSMLQPGFEPVLKEFEEREGVEIVREYAGCGILVGNMRGMKQGSAKPAQFPDAYFSCDVSYMEKVRDWFEASRTITQNQIVIAVPKGNRRNIRSLADLTSQRGLRIGLGHATNSALGALTDQMLRGLGLREALYGPPEQPHHTIVPADAGHTLIGQLRAGSLDAALVYRSNVQANPANLEYLEVIPIALREALARQPFAVSKDSPHKHLMHRLLERVLSAQSRQRFETIGFDWLAQEKAP